MKYLITGKQGQLARAFIRKFEQQSLEYVAPEESRLDITDPTVVLEVVSSCKPDVIINCAAYNLVDKAEKEQDSAFGVNAIGPQILARTAAKQKAVLVHFGSDYVFDGAKEKGLYTENDPVNPLNIYGKSKLIGEQNILKDTDRYLILRLSWVFGEGEQNYIHKIIQWSKNSDYLKATCDEFSVPTSTETVVDATLKALDRGLSGLYHLTNTGFCSRYEWTRLVLDTLGMRKFVRPLNLEAFNLAAQRPKFSAMSNKKIANMLDLEIPTWEEAVKTFLTKS